MTISKKKSLFEHAKIRALERYGIELTPELHQEVVEAVHGEKTSIIKRQSERVTVREIKLDDKQVRFVFNQDRHAIVTFLYRDERDYYVHEYLGAPEGLPVI